MRIAIVAESFLPSVNGVTNSILRAVEQLAGCGDDVLVIAPSSTPVAQDTVVGGVPVLGVPSVPLAGYPAVRVAFGGVGRIRRALAEFAPDVVHLASPFELGWRASRAAAQLNLPTVAVYQTDVAGYAIRYGLPLLADLAWQRIDSIHRMATRTLVPSSAALDQLRGRGIPRVAHWPRGVDARRFSPAKRSGAFRASVAPHGERLIGYVGRLAPEKQVEDLRALLDIPGTRMVIVGDGPQRAALQEMLPGARFTGFLAGEDLAVAVASLDVFVHPGELETFGQTIQEAMASGVPVVATGSGGPLDLVDSSRTGWLYPPGDLATLRSRVVDLVGDEAKRAAFGVAAVHQVRGRSWEAVCELLRTHYSEVVDEHALLTLRDG